MIIALLVAVAVVGAGVYGVTVILSNEWGRSRIDLVESFTNVTDPEWPYLDAVDRTSDLCGPTLQCVQAVGNEYLTLLKFGDVEAARLYAQTLGTGGVQIDPLVVHFDGVPLSAEICDEIVITLSNINVDWPD